ncbi:MAG: hypothetical protein ACYDEG_03420 [bacterium]
MENLKFIILEKLTVEDIYPFDFENFKQNRVFKYLWTELMVNPEAVPFFRQYLNDNSIKEHFNKAILYYFSYKYELGIINKQLEELESSGFVKKYENKDLTRKEWDQHKLEYFKAKEILSWRTEQAN